MRRWFLSYHSPDQGLAERLKDAIERKDPASSVFFAPTALRAGGSWSAQLAQEIADATAFILLIGPAGVGNWQVPEYDEALDRWVKSGRTFPLIVVVVKGQTAPGLQFLHQLHWIISADPASEKDIARLFDAVSGSDSRLNELWRYASPYRGLEAMEEKDSDYFFGRTRETVQALEALAAPDRLPVLIGNSGVGKSSLAQAGVVASLKRQAWPEEAKAGNAWPTVFEGSRQWCYLALKPGTEPIKALVESFIGVWQFGATDPVRADHQHGWTERLCDGRATLSDLIEATDGRRMELDQPKPPGFFLYIDQGEELYVRAEQGQRRRFSELVSEALAHPRLRTMMSLRSDFLGALQSDAPLFKSRHQIDVPPLSENGLRDVVSRPAQMLGARFAPESLIDIIALRTAEDSIKDVGALPLLSYTLDDMWRQMVSQGDGMLRLPAQSFEIGGVLVDRANRFVAGHPASEATLRRILTLRLADVRADGEPTRRRASRGEFSDEEWRLVSELADYPNRLLVTATTEAGDVYAEVAHEAIFRRWGKLREWITAEREFLTWRNGLEMARRSWDATPEASKSDALLMGLALTQAQGWLAKRAEDLPVRERTFIALSLEREQKAQQQRQAVRRRALIASFVATALIAVFAAGASWEWHEASIESSRAVAAEHRADQERDMTISAVGISESLSAMITRPGQAGSDPQRALKQILDQSILSYTAIISLNPSYAEAYNGRGSALHDEGQLDQALADFNKAILLDPTVAVYFNNLALVYNDMGKFDTAIANLTQAIKLDPKYAHAFVNRGYSYYRKGDYNNAAKDYSQAIVLDPNYELAYNNRADIYYRLKQYSLAITDYTKVLEIDPSANAYDNRGAVENDKGDYSSAMADFNQAIALNPNVALYYSDRALTYYRLGNYAQAIVDYTKDISLDPKNALAYRNRGDTYFHKGDYDKAIADYTQAISIDGKDTRTYDDRADSYVKKGDYTHAIADYNQAISIDPNDTRARNSLTIAQASQAIAQHPDDAAAYQMRAAAYEDQGEYDQAIADYTKVIDLHPKDPDGYKARAAVYLENHDTAHAIADYSKAIELAPNDADLYRKRGKVYENNHDFSRAIADYTKLIALDPRSADTYESRGTAYVESKDYDHAIADYTQEITLDPKDAAAHTLRGVAYDDKGDHTDAITDFNQAISLDPKAAGAYNGRCWSRLISNGDLQQALADCNQSLQLQPNDAAALNSRGFVYYRLGRIDDAIADFQASLAVDPKLAESLYGLGLAKQKKGDQAGANAEFTAAKAINPDIVAQLSAYGLN